MSENKGYTKKDFETALEVAFVEKGALWILMDGHEAQSEFLRGGIEYGLEKGWLVKHGEIKDSQYSGTTYALSKKGKNHFGIDICSQCSQSNLCSSPSSVANP